MVEGLRHVTCGSRPAFVPMRFPFVRHRRPAASDSVLWRGRFGIGSGRRIELNLHLFFVLTLVTVTWLLALTLFPRFFPGWEPAAYWLVAGAVAVCDSVAGLLHELGHAIVALAKGRRVYRITLYGLAAAARRSGGPSRPREQLAISVAGPLSHLLMASLLYTAWNMLPTDNEPLRVAAGFPAFSNFTVGILNLVPVSPLDGGRAARALIAGIFRV
jgi:Zn-dependent protease